MQNSRELESHDAEILNPEIGNRKTVNINRKKTDHKICKTRKMVALVNSGSIVFWTLDYKKTEETENRDAFSRKLRNQKAMTGKIPLRIQNLF